MHNCHCVCTRYFWSSKLLPARPQRLPWPFSVKSTAVPPTQRFQEIYSTPDLTMVGFLL
jgi:hypothetical protein